MKQSKTKITNKELYAYVINLDNKISSLTSYVQREVQISINSVMKLLEQYIDMNGDTKKLIKHIGEFVEQEKLKIEEMGDES